MRFTLPAWEGFCITGGQDVRKRILTYFVAMLAAAVVATTVIMTLLTYSLFKNRVIDDLSVDARVVAAMMEGGNAPQILGEMQDALRITIVSPAGEVVYDNWANAARMDNHAYRREIKQAFDTGEGYDVREVSKILGISETAVKARLMRGRKRLKALLSEEVFEE